MGFQHFEFKLQSLEDTGCFRRPCEHFRECGPWTAHGQTLFLRSTAMSVGMPGSKNGKVTEILSTDRAPWESSSTVAQTWTNFKNLSPQAERIR